MALPPGTRLGPYDVVGPLGAGGMGEVYRARDTRLGRDVAIKVLPDEVTADPTRLRRFEQEARATAALNHPNILAVYDIGHEGERAYIVAELLDGRTLREMLGRETLTLPRVIDLASQIADGLAAAHGRTIVHRDLKPENIFVTGEGRAKILDFGLAKTIESEADPAFVPTRLGTAPYTVLGTAGYMAPEQARAQPVDHRADVFAFGAVLYEMVTGRRAFDGDTALDRMTAILREAPAPIVSTATRPLPPVLVRIVDRCLEKSPAARFQSTADLAFALKSLSQADTTTSGVATLDGTAGRARSTWLPWAIATLAVLGAGLVWAASRQTQELAPRPANGISTIDPPPGESFDAGGSEVSPHPAISPDGQRVLFTLNRGVQREEIWVQSVRETNARSLNVIGTQPFWSADSRSIGFFHERQLKAVDVESAAVRTIADLSAGGGGSASWSQTGVILFSRRNEIVQVREGGIPSPVTSLDTAAGQTSHQHPFFVDGRRFLYQSMPDRGIWLGSLDGEPAKFLLHADSKAQYAPPNWLLYVLDDALYARKIDVERAEVEGATYLLVRDVRANESNGRATFSVSWNGALVYRTGGEGMKKRLVWMDAAGKELAVPDPVARWGVMTFVDDRHAIAVINDESGGGSDLWTVDLVTGYRTRLTTDPAKDDLPVLSEDHKSLAYYSTRSGRGQVLTRHLNDAGGDQVWEQIRCLDKEEPAVSDWSRNWVIYACRGPSSSDIWAMPTDGSSSPKPYLHTRARETLGRLSRDEQWIVYQSDDSGANEIYAQLFQGGGQPRSVSGPGGGANPEWSDDGLQIIYRKSNRLGAVMAVAVTRTSSVLEFGKPRELPWSQPGRGFTIAIARDLSHALMTKPVDGTARDTPLIVRDNWLQLLGTTK